MRFAILLGALALASPALADDDVEHGTPCATTADCGSLRCIDGVCHDPLDPDANKSSLGRDVMFGTNNGYAVQIAIVDGIATLTEPLLMIGTQALQDEQRTIFGVLCFLPVSLAGSITHWAHGRVVPGIISLFAWASHAATTFVVAGLFGIETNGGFDFNYTAAWAAGLGFGALGAAGLIALDAWMAREVPAHEPTRPRIFPSLAPTRGGAIASVGGMF